MNKTLLLLPIICYGASGSSETMQESPIVYGGRWATMVVETQLMLSAEEGFKTPKRVVPTVPPKPPLHPVAVRPIKKYLEMSDLRPEEGSYSGIPGIFVPQVKRKLDFLDLSKKK